jgi:hypothetical protein
MKSYKILSIVIFLFTSFATSSGMAQTKAKQPYITIEGEVKNKMVLLSDDIDKLPKTTIAAKDHSGKKQIYSGVEIGILLKNAGVTLGEELRGENLIKYLMVTAKDGYHVIFSLAEVDPTFTNRKIILANRKNGEVFSNDEGPFQIIIEGEKRLARNVRQVVSLKLKSAN